MNISMDTMHTVIYSTLVNEICQQSDYIKYIVKYKQFELDDLKTENTNNLITKQNEIDNLKEELAQFVHKLNEKQNELDLLKKETQTVLTVTQLEINKLKEENKFLNGKSKTNIEPSIYKITPQIETKKKLFNFKINFG
jgi:hypothetical protein